MIDLGKVKPGTLLRGIPFGSYAASTGASSATTGYAAADIQIYKDSNTTQRASAAGITVTADFDTLTGINWLDIDLADNTTADFYAAGSQYTVVVADVTIDSQTVRFPIARFSIGVDGAILDTTLATLSSQTSFTLTAGPADNNALVGCEAYIHDAASAVQCAMGTVSAYSGSSKTVTLASDPAIFTMAAKDNISFFPRRNVYSAGGVAWGSGAITAGSIAADAITAAKIADGAIDAATFAAGAINAAAIASDAITDAKVAADVTIASVTGAVGSVTGNVGGNVAGTVAGVTPLDAAGTRSAIGLGSANLDTQLDALPTNGELATALAAADDAVLTQVALILAMLDDARGEPGQGNPPVNPDLATKIDYLYKAWRNKHDNNGTETKLYADNGTTVDQKQTTSSVGGTVTKGEWATGA